MLAPSGATEVFQRWVRELGEFKFPLQKVDKGDPLVSIEAMKMETMIRAERNRMIGHAHVKPGAVISVKDLLIEFVD